MPLPAGHNVVLIGMPWSGKSTVGVLLAKALTRNFVDTDLVIQAAEARSLQDIINMDGVPALRAIEERRVLALACCDCVIATGGSVVYSDPAMRHLKSNGVCLYLQLPVEHIEKRAVHADSRGLIRAPGQTLRDLYAERIPLYERYADIVLPCANFSTHEEAVSAAMKCIIG